MDLFEEVERIIDQGEICDSCMGQVFAERGHGLTNRERGTAWKTILAMENNNIIERKVDCWVCLGESYRFEEWADLAVMELGEIEFKTYKIGTRMSPLLDENAKLLRELVGVPIDSGESLKTEMNREVGKIVGDRMKKYFDADSPDIIILLNVPTRSVEIQVNPIFIYGRYKKLIRGIPQTKWPCGECKGRGTSIHGVCERCEGSGKQYEESVQELIDSVAIIQMEGESSTFHGAGREDIDAKMLGTGRPFVVEIKTPKKRSIDLQVLEENMNKNAFGKVEVELEGVVNRKMVAHIKELPASKTYEARIKFDRSVEKDILKGALGMLDGAEIKQETPTRVVHRRADKTRIRKVYSAKGELTSDLTANLEIHGEKGLYIKELVSGDSGRTNPNLTDLIGVEAVVETLDVISVVAEEGRFDVPEYILRRKDKKGLEE